MEKIIKIGEKDVKLKASASFAFRYKAAFQKDILQTLMPMLQALVPLIAIDKDLDEMDAQQLVGLLGAQEIDVELTDIYSIVWVLAKTADPNIPPVMEWLDEFDEFPLVEILPEAFDLLIPTLVSSKKPKKKRTTKATSQSPSK